MLFFPYALFDRDAYAAQTGERFGRMGYEIDSAHRARINSLANTAE